MPWEKKQHSDYTSNSATVFRQLIAYQAKDNA
jgi:hypothetical protein